MTGPVDERALVERARHDADAFAELYRRHVDAIFRFAWRGTGSREAAEDVTSATFERALARLDRYRPTGAGFGAWLHRLAAHEVAEHHRRRARHRTPRALAVQRRLVGGSAPDPADQAATEADRIRAALDRLRPRHRRLLTLRYFAELDRDELAVATGLSPATLDVNLHRARQALRRALEGT